MTTCEICGSTQFSIIATEIREGQGLIAQCEHCQLIFQQLDWGVDQIRDYYDSEYQVTNSLVTGRSLTPREHYEDRLKTIQPLFENIQPLLKNNMRVLEVGCGAGALLSKIRPHVKDCAGIELNQSFVKFINEELGIKAFSEDLMQIVFPNTFDLIISIDTLDHLPNPFFTLQKINRLLTSDGMVYLEVPNQQDAFNLFLPEENRVKYNKFFWHRAHLFYFTHETIVKLFERTGFYTDISCRHNYTLKNFLNWFFSGQPQKSFVAGTTDVGLFPGKSDFESQMNLLFEKIEPEFKQIMSTTFHGDTLCCLAKKK